MINGVNVSIRAAGGDWRPLPGRVIGGNCATFEHGFLSASVELATFAGEALAMYAAGVALEIAIYAGVYLLFEGDVTSIEPTEDKTKIEAAGPWAALGNRPYTQLWLDDDLSQWKELNSENVGAASPNFTIKTGGRELSISLKDGGTYTSSDYGMIGYFAPENGGDIGEIVFTLNSVLPSSDYKNRLHSYIVSPSGGASGALSGGATELSINGTNSSTNTQAIDSGKNSLVFSLQRSTGTETYSGNTDDAIAIYTDITVKRNTGTMYSGDVISHIVGTFSGDDAARVSSDDSQIENGAELRGRVVYEDIDPRRAIEDLETRGDDSEVFAAVFWGRVLSFRPRSEYGRTVYINQQIIKIKRDQSEAITGVIPVYRDGATNQTRRGDEQRNLEREALYSHKIIETYNAQTTNGTQAETQAAIKLSDADDSPRFSISGDWVQDSGGNKIPSYFLRALDRVQINGVPFSAGDAAGMIQIKETRLDFKSGKMELIPAKRPNTLMQYLARQ